ncbi:MAG: hypothetical protein CM15mV92_370 [Caudoviricetes sp.]|nr:MAG: hypothetical protein CM15mV92_370 [Caudoviricetes sp.]
MVLGVLRKQSNFETDLDLTFRFKLARELSMTVGELMTTIAQGKFQSMDCFYKWETGEINKAKSFS